MTKKLLVSILVLMSLFNFKLANSETFIKAKDLFQNNNIDDLESSINTFLNDDQQIKFKKRLILKKNSKKYSLFCHYQKLNKILS